MTTSADVLSAALTLLPADRAEVARQLLLSLEPTPVDEGHDLAWEEEIRRRLKAIRSGEIKLRDWDDVLAGARNSIAPL